MNVVQVAPQAEPKQLTVNYRPTTTQEMAAAFLNVNNQNGWLPDDDFHFDIPIEGPLAAKLFEITSFKYIHIVELRNRVHACQWTYLSRSVKLARVYNLVAFCLGYPSHPVLAIVAKARGNMVRNYRTPDELRELFEKYSQPVE